MDAYRRGDQFLVHLDLPGVDPDAIELTVEQNALTIKAERRFEPEEGDELLITERPQGTFTRQLLLGESLDTDRLEADYDHGVLTLRIPVAEAAKPRRVEITKSAGGQRAIVEAKQRVRPEEAKPASDARRDRRDSN
jgi:HSP20 family protein